MAPETPKKTCIFNSVIVNYNTMAQECTLEVGVASKPCQLKALVETECAKETSATAPKRQGKRTGE
jgi:hypothetical protein